MFAVSEFSNNACGIIMQKYFLTLKAIYQRNSTRGAAQGDVLIRLLWSVL